MGQVIDCSGPAYDRFLHPLMLAALNCDPAEGSTTLAARIIRESIMLGGKACRPRIARDGLSHALIEPALAYLETRNVPVRFGKRLRAIELAAAQADGARLRRRDDRADARRPRHRGGSAGGRGVAGA